MVRLQEPEGNKIKPKQEGPFVITKVLGPVTYRLLLLALWQIHNVFHAKLLRKYKENEVYGKNFMEPPPELVEGEEAIRMRLKQSSIIEIEDKDISISSNGRVILSPRHHEN